MLLQPVGVVRPGISVLITLEAFIEDGVKVCGIYELRGSVKLQPKAWLRAVREEVTKLERIAKAAGCEEMRIAGRDWSRILRDYEPCDGLTNGLRKGLV